MRNGRLVHGDLLAVRLHMPGEHGTETRPWSGETCAACGAVKAKLSLAERLYLCQACGYTEDRDVNAARNLLKLAVSGTESINACGPQGW
jgi:transposase